MNEQPVKELGFKKSSKIISYIRQFSATEKAIFCIFVLAALVATAIMAQKINNHFMVEVPAEGGTLHEGEVGLPRNINPVLSITDSDKDISSLVYSGLMKWSDRKIVPDIAKSYKVSDDGLVYSFILKSDIYFQDGTILTSDDVAFTIQKIQDPILKSPRKSDWKDVTVQVISPTEIHFILKQAYAPFLANTTMGILPQHIWNTVNDDQFIFSHYNIEPIGSGPYKVSSVSYDSSGIPVAYNLSTWGRYYGKIPYLSNISLSFFSDEDKALAALDSGAIDSLATVSANEAAKLATDKAQPYTVLETPLPRIFGIFFNQSQAPVLADKVVRQALEMSVDRSSLVKSVLSGYGKPIEDPLPLEISGQAMSSSSLAVNVPMAQSLLEKNGWKRDPASGIYTKKPAKGAAQTLSFDIYTSDAPDLKQTAEMISKGWNDMGADTDVRVFSASDLYQNVIRTRKYDALLFGEQIGKDQDLYAFWHSSQIKSPGLNVSLYANSKVDKLLEDIRTTSDDKALAAKYSQFSDLVAADIPAIFLYSPDFIYVVPKTLRGIILNDVTVPADRWSSISRWYMGTEKIWSFLSR